MTDWVEAQLTVSILGIRLQGGEPVRKECCLARRLRLWCWATGKDPADCHSATVECYHSGPNVSKIYAAGVMLQPPFDFGEIPRHILSHWRKTNMRRTLAILLALVLALSLAACSQPAQEETPAADAPAAEAPADEAPADADPGSARCGSRHPGQPGGRRSLGCHGVRLCPL